MKISKHSIGHIRELVTVQNRQNPLSLFACFFVSSPFCNFTMFCLDVDSFLHCLELSNLLPMAPHLFAIHLCCCMPLRGGGQYYSLAASNSLILSPAISNLLFTPFTFLKHNSFISNISCRLCLVFNKLFFTLRMTF